MIFTAIIFSFLNVAHPPAQSKNYVPDSNPVNKQLILKLVNKARKEGRWCGTMYFNAAPPLVWNDQLEVAATVHSNEMHQKNYFNHIGTDGSNGGVRIDNAGYVWRTYGENIGWGYLNEQQVVDAWLKSPGHCKNIMNKDFKEMAVARAGNYWTQDFGAKD